MLLIMYLAFATGYENLTSRQWQIQNRVQRTISISPYRDIFELELLNISAIAVKFLKI